MQFPSVRRPWNPVEEDQLRALYPSAPWIEIMKDLNRSYETIRGKAWRMGLRRIHTTVQREALQERRLVAQLSEPECAYLAGLIDGEGSFIKRKSGRRIISLGSTCEEVIDWLVEKLGGQKYATTLGPLSKRPLWRWFYTRSKAAETLIERMSPYLIIKKTH